MVIRTAIIVAAVAVGASVRCFAGVARLNSVASVTNLVYDVDDEHRRSCVVAPGWDMNRFEYWNTSDTNAALWAAVLYSRFVLAERLLPVEERTVSTIADFPVMHDSDYVINDVCVKNMDAAVFTFVVRNPNVRNTGHFAVVKFSEGGLFLYAVYVNLATGKSDLEFLNISGARLVLARENPFPFLSKQECRYQKAIVARVK